jgi:hypothetical protein
MHKEFYLFIGMGKRGGLGKKEAVNTLQRSLLAHQKDPDSS